MANKDAKPRKVRVLVDIPHAEGVHKHNSVIELSDEEIKAHGTNVDADPEAVAYAESLAPKAEPEKKA